MRRSLGIAVAAIGICALAVPAAVGDGEDEAFGECAAPTEAPVLTVGAVDCLRFESDAIGGVSAFSYFIPPSCDPALERDCPVLYYLHGTGGDLRDGTGAKGGTPSGWVQALAAGPAVDPRTTAEPWQHSDASTWVPRPSIDMIIVSPHGQTLVDGHGPVADANPFWVNWNPRYAQGGDSQRYDTPAPRFDDYLVDEIIPYVDRTFPTVGDRAYRAMVGYSMGGIGSFAVGFRHPDLFASLGMQSGGTFPFNAGDDVAPAAPVPIAPPVDIPYTQAPGAVPTLVPEEAWQQLYGASITVGFGDFVADNAWWRHSQPASLVQNSRAHAASGEQSLHLQYFVNDAIPRRTEDVTELPYMGLFFEAVLSPTNRVLEQLFDRYAVERTWHIGPGHHWDPYQTAYLREQLEGQYAHVRHWDGGGAPGPAADVFDFQTIDRELSIWGWQFAVERPALEFLHLTDVSCTGLTLRGTGSVTVTVPASCGTGVAGAEMFVVDLGPSQATDEMGGSVSGDGYGRTVTVPLTPL